MSRRFLVHRDAGTRTFVVFARPEVLFHPEALLACLRSDAGLERWQLGASERDVPLLHPSLVGALATAGFGPEVLR